MIDSQSRFEKENKKVGEKFGETEKLNYLCTRKTRWRRSSVGRAED